MVPTNKILTVAYGTFSCTLEGFDDPFSAMTEIAEYFRDLAADDRFFGAEPPTPDMATLRTIAEARARHGVEAQTDEKGVTLRPAAAGAATVAVAETVTEPEAATDGADVDPDMDADDLVAEAIDAVVAEDENDAAFDTFEAETSEDVDEAVADATDEAAVEEVESYAELTSDVEAIDAVSAIIDDEEAAAFDDELNIATPPNDADGGIAEKLARIRGVVEADRQPSSVYAEDEHAETSIEHAFADMQDDDVANPEPIETSEAEVEAETSDEESTEVDLAEDTLEADVAAALSLSADDMVEEDALEEAESIVAVEEISEVHEEDAQEKDASEDVSELSDDAPETEEQAEAEADEIAEEEPAEQAKPKARFFRIRKLRRSEDEAAQDTDNNEEIAAADDDAVEAIADQADEMPVVEADEEDDDLMAELAAIEAELDRDPAQVVAEDAEDALEADENDDLMSQLAAIRDEQSDDAEDDLPAAEQASDEIDEDSETSETTEAEAEASEAETDEDDAAVPSDPDMERLFAATDSRLSGEDTSRRHANISHLKAAVAARRADGPVEPKDDDTDAYRADLASTVRPRRAETPAEGRTARPERPSPLVLVSEQRVEPVSEEAAAEEPPAEVAADGTDFEIFASDVGAVDLADVLEAAAVYSTKVLGQPNFSRPRLLHLASEAYDDLSREDGLRGFGQLLRDGKIHKVSRGTFAVSSESRYNEEAERRAG